MTIDEVKNIVLQLPVFQEVEPITAVYFLMRDYEVVYVGQTADLAARVKSHRKDKSKLFDAVRYIVVEIDQLDAVEKQLINTLNPRLNSRYASPRYSRRQPSSW